MQPASQKTRNCKKNELAIFLERNCVCVWSIVDAHLMSILKKKKYRHVICGKEKHWTRRFEISNSEFEEKYKKMRIINGWRIRKEFVIRRWWEFADGGKERSLRKASSSWTRHFVVSILSSCCSFPPHCSKTYCCHPLPAQPVRPTRIPCPALLPFRRKVGRAGSWSNRVAGAHVTSHGRPLGHRWCFCREPDIGRRVRWKQRRPPSKEEFSLPSTAGSTELDFEFVSPRSILFPVVYHRPIDQNNN